jgi:preprotein translocase subunit SecG
MISILIALHIIIVLSMIGLILLQRSEGGGFGASPSSSVFSVRGKTDFMTRTTAFLATAFFVNCFVLALLASRPDKTLKKPEGGTHTEAPALPTAPELPSGPKK